jgi:hypothetical protein
MSSPVESFENWFGPEAGRRSAVCSSRAGFPNVDVRFIPLDSLPSPPILIFKGEPYLQKNTSVLSAQDKCTTLNMRPPRPS